MQNNKKSLYFGCVSLVLILFTNDVGALIPAVEPVEACLIPSHSTLTQYDRSLIAHCLDWQPNDDTICNGAYRPIAITPISTDNEVHIAADSVSLYTQGRSTLDGHVEIKETNRIITAKTAYIHRDAQSNQITSVELIGNVHYIQPDRYIVAERITLDPRTKEAQVNNVLYRFNSQRASSILPSWGRAGKIEHFADDHYQLTHATYTTCAPQDKIWHIEANTIDIDHKTSVGKAYHAKLLVGDVPILYSPYLTFPTSNERKSGFLIPTIGGSNVGGLDFSIPYYLNLAPNYDATLIPHVYTNRGLMMGGQFRYLTNASHGEISGSFLPNDRAYNDFLRDNVTANTQFVGAPTDRWSVMLRDLTQISPNLQFRLDYEQVSDDYYLQDFSSNLAILTERQLAQEAALTYTDNHWLIQTLLQRYQTLQPINESVISDIYQRLPQVKAQGNFDDLWFNGDFSLFAQGDNFAWPNGLTVNPEGQRYYVNPVLSFPQTRPGGFITPSVEWVGRYYDLNNYSSINLINSYDFLSNTFVYPSPNYPNNIVRNAYFQDSIPRYSIDTGLYFDRDIHLFNHLFNQTLEPHLYYLNVPYRNQTQIPVFDSGLMIFDVDQLFRSNRFSGFDRIGDTNQLSYAVTTRWLSAATGVEKANFTVGQIAYFADRRVQLCQNSQGYCIDDPLTLGYLNPDSAFSPIASRLNYHFNRNWSTIANYVWDVDSSQTYNSNLIFQYQTAENNLINFGYTYLENGDITLINNVLQPDPLHQVTVSFAKPVTERWSLLGAYNYNISKGYEMLSFLGVQYDSCCWAIRLIGGRSFQSLSSALQPQYNNNVYLQVQLKGLGSMGNSDPGSTIRTYLPGYIDTFHRN